MVCDCLVRTCFGSKLNVPITVKNKKATL